MRITKWYDIRKTADDFFMLEYRKKNRIVSGVNFAFILIIYLIYTNFGHNLISPPLLIIVYIIFIYFFIMGMIIDKYKFDIKGRKIVHSIGIYPVKRQKIFKFEEIESVNYNKIDLIYKKNDIYSFYMMLNNGQKLDFSRFQENSVLYELVKKINKDIDGKKEQ